MEKQELKVRRTVSPPGASDPAAAPTATILQEKVKRLLRTMEKGGYTQPVTLQDPAGLAILRAWAHQERIPVNDVAWFFQERLTEKGRNWLASIANEYDLDFETPSGFLDVLARSVPEAGNREGDIAREVDVGERIGDLTAGSRERAVGQETIVETGRMPRCFATRLRETLGGEPSRLVDDKLAEDLAMGLEDAAAGKVPLKAWMLNPRAAARLLGALAEQATTQGYLRKEISETTKWLVEVAASDAKRDALLDRVAELEQAVGSCLRQFCYERGLPMPAKGTPERVALLLRVNSEMVALQTREKEIAKRGEKLVATQVEMRSEAANNRMLAQELPAVIESAREANTLKERLMTEEIRHVLSTLMVSASGAMVGLAGGLLAGIESAVGTVVEKHPQVALSLGAGLATFVLQVVVHAEGLTGQHLQTFALRGALVTLISAVATGLGVGLVVRAARGKENERRNDAKEEQAVSAQKGTEAKGDSPVAGRSGNGLPAEFSRDG